MAAGSKVPAGHGRAGSDAVTAGRCRAVIGNRAKHLLGYAPAVAACYGLTIRVRLRRRRTDLLSGWPGRAEPAVMARGGLPTASWLGHDQPGLPEEPGCGPVLEAAVARGIGRQFGTNEPVRFLAAYGWLAQVRLAFHVTGELRDQRLGQCGCGARREIIRPARRAPLPAQAPHRQSQGWNLLQRRRLPRR
jgi:hypothetical protein